MTPPAPFRISNSQLQAQQIRKLKERAKSAGSHQEFVEALKVIRRQLEVDPVAFGDRTHTLTGLKVPIYHRIFSILMIRYGVDVSRRLVYLQHIDLFPSNLGL